MEPSAEYVPRGPAQAGFRYDFDTPNCILVSGWAGGKTITAADKVCERAARNDGNGILGGQHYRHLRYVMVAKVVERAEARGLRPKMLEGGKVVLFRALPRPNQFGCQFAFGLSADAPDAIRAVEGTWGWFDEPGAYSESRIDAIRDAPLQFEGRVRGHDAAPGRDWSGTNEGPETTFYQMQVDARSGERTDVAVYQGSSRDNVEYLGQEWIEAKERALPPEMIAQYLDGGVGQLNQELAAWAWRPAMIDEWTLRQDLPLVTCWDFGVAPFAMSIMQQEFPGGPCHWLDEIVIDTGGNTADATRYLCERFRPLHPGPVIIFGDATGAAGSAQAKHANYEQMHQIMSSYWTIPGSIISYVPAANPGIETRLLAANAAIADGLVTVGQRCKNLLRDLRGCRLIQGQAGKKEDQKNGYSHSWVGMCYALAQLFPLGSVTSIGGGTEGAMVSWKTGTVVDPKMGASGRRNPVRVGS